MFLQNLFELLHVYAKNSTKNNQNTFDKNQQKQQYSSSNRNLGDVYSRPSGGLEDVLFLHDFA